jgi:hypothetical protein
MLYISLSHCVASYSIFSPSITAEIGPRYVPCATPCIPSLSFSLPSFQLNSSSTIVSCCQWLAEREREREKEREKGRKEWVAAVKAAAAKKSDTPPPPSPPTKSKRRRRLLP